MKIKKILAFSAALAMLSVSGMTAFAEESVTTSAETTSEYISEAEVSTSDGIKEDNDSYEFTLDGVSFYAKFGFENKESVNEYGNPEYDKYIYVSIYNADGTPTRVKNRFADCIKNSTGGADFSITDYVIVSGNEVTVVNKTDLAANVTYVYDKESNMLVNKDDAENGEAVGSTTEAETGSGSQSSNIVTNSPETSDSMSVPVFAASAAVVLGAVVYISKKRK